MALGKMTGAPNRDISGVGFNSKERGLQQGNKAEAAPFSQQSLATCAGVDPHMVG